MRRVILTGIVMLLPLFAAAQEQAVLYSHMNHNGLSVNPAYCGSHGMLSIALTHRSQWIGFEGAPSFNTFSLHSPLKDTKVGLGLIVMNESIGLRRYNGIYINYAHRLALGRGVLAMGLKAGVSAGTFETIDLGNGDLVFSENAEKYLLPNFGIGIYYHTDNFNAGLSVPMMLGYETSGNGEVIAYHDFKKYTSYGTVSLKVPLSENWKINPAVLAQYNQATGLVMEGGVSMLYRDMLGAGAGYRNKGSVIMMIDCRVTQQLKIGLAYDYGLSGINTYNRSSVEVAFEYNFGYRIKMANPTLF